jgi:hypothetical protein
LPSSSLDTNTPASPVASEASEASFVSFASSQEDPAIASCEEAYKEGRTAIEEGKAILREVAGSTAHTNNDSIMGDETAHKKRAAENLFLKDDQDPDM